MVAGVILVACKKETTLTDTQAVKQQKSDVVPLDEMPDVLYSPDGVNFFNENGEPVTLIHVEFGEAYGHAQIATNGNVVSILSCEAPGNDCGSATILNDVTGESWNARYAIMSNGTIIVERSPNIH